MENEKMATFNYDLKQGWKMQQTIDAQGKESMNFKNELGASITLNNDSVKKLREIFKAQEPK